MLIRHSRTAFRDPCLVGTEDMAESSRLLKLEGRKFSSTYHRVSVLLSEGELGTINIPFLTGPSAFSTYLLHLGTTVTSLCQVSYLDLNLFSKDTMKTKDADNHSGKKILKM